MASRRGVLKLIGGGVVLAAGAGGAYWFMNGPSDEARQAWREAGQPTEYRRRFLSYALLAPNPHNRQPWAVKLEGEDALTFYCDLDKRLPETDPFDRQITLGCGAFLELLSIAASHSRMRADITPFPEGEPGERLDKKALAHVRFSSALEPPDPAFDFILARRTNRNVYDQKEVTAQALDELAAAGSAFGHDVRTTGEGELAAKLRDLTWRAHQVEMLNPRTLKESVDLMRIGRAEVNAHRDGLSMEGPVIEAMHSVGLMTQETMMDVNSVAFKAGMDQFKDKAMSAKAYAWLLSGKPGRAGQLEAGRAYARLALKASELNLAIHPWSQSLQEYAEMKPLYDEVHALIGEKRRIEMLVRVGHADPVEAAPRRGVDDLVKA
ncbi:MAG TPA: hypothetical protein VG942_12285 [Hyphomonadaceae bacterium]|nr:hypothetical protein [Hyphomonadaceae bacterium]